MKPSSDSPVPDDRLCKYFFEVDYIPTVEAESIEFVYQIPTDSGTEYLLSFLSLIDDRSILSRDVEARIPNPFQADWTVAVNGITIGSGQGGLGAEWETLSDTFLGTGNDEITIYITAMGRKAIFRFDNFIVIPIGINTPTSTQSASLISTTATPGSSYVSATPSDYVSATATSYSSESAPSPTTICPFATSGSIIPDGGFEDNLDFFTSTKSGAGTLTAAPYPAASVPVANPLACQYVLMVHIQTSRGSTELDLTYDFDAEDDEVYNISFQNLVCGSGGRDGTWSVSVGTAIIQSGSIVGGCTTWNTYSKNFVTSGDNELIVSFDVPGVAISDVYFDNFIIVPVDSPEATSRSTRIRPTILRTSSSVYTTQAPEASSSTSAETSSSTTSAASCPFSTTGSLV